jgi:hypothetical protein
MDNEKISQAAHDVSSWIQDAVGDMAHSYHDFLDDKWKNKIKKAKSEGVIDLKGWLADEYYNDIPTLQDLCGDRIHDESMQIAGTYKTPLFDEVYIKICEKMIESAHANLVCALDRLIANHKQRIKKHEAKELP